ncbi:MAG: alpha/beta hydrolase [Bacteroidia bacterium]|nr:alpha/beta hydrolase [Bacteroidia bacterium]
MIELFGRKIGYSDSGKGRVLVFLHGFPESRVIWEPLTKALSGSYRIITIDLPGFGDSECIGYVHSMDAMADHVKMLLDELSLRKYVICGHSMGGYVALAFAARFRNHLSGLILFHSTAAADAPEKRTDRDRAIAAVKADKRAFVFQLLERLFAPENLPLMTEPLEQLKRIAGNTSPQAIVAALEGMKIRTDYIAMLPELEFPVLFIAGKKDVIIPCTSIQAQAKKCREGEVLLLENAGHMGFFESPVTSEKGIRGFLRKCFGKK